MIFNLIFFYLIYLALANFKSFSSYVDLVHTDSGICYWILPSEVLAVSREQRSRRMLHRAFGKVLRRQNIPIDLSKKYKQNRNKR